MLHFNLIFSVLQPLYCNTRRTKVQVLLIETGVLHEVRNLISRNEMLCLCCFGWWNYKILWITYFWWALLSKDEACHTLESLLQNHHAVFLELGVVYQPARERYIYLLKNTLWQHLSSWSPGKSFSSSQSSEWWITSVSAVCMSIQSSVCKTANTYLCPPLWPHAVINWVQTANCSSKLLESSH